LPNGWIINWRPRDRIDHQESYENASCDYCMRFKISTLIMINSTSNKYFTSQNIESWEKVKSSGIEYIDLDDCTLSQFTLLFNWLVNNPPQTLN
jgi:hypothetical protein